MIRSNPAFVVFTEPTSGKTQYALFVGGGVFLADGVSGPYTEVGKNAGPGSNPAPMFYQGAW